jgi:prepilin-type processing-associated H-X9-DG protein
MIQRLILRFPRTGWMLAVALTGALAGGILNAVAAAIAPVWFHLQVRPACPGIAAEWNAMLFGLRHGALLGTIVGGGLLLWRRQFFTLDWFRLPGRMAAAAAAGWVLGGLGGLARGRLTPEAFLSSRIASLPTTYPEILQYAPVVGSITGSVIFVLLAAYAIGGRIGEQNRVILPEKNRIVYIFWLAAGGAFGLHWLYLERWKIAIIQLLFFITLTVIFNTHGNSWFIMLFPWTVLIALSPLKDAWKRPMKHRLISFPLSLLCIPSSFLFLILCDPCSNTYSRQLSCQSNLKELGRAVVMYQSDHNGWPPASLKQLSLEYANDRTIVCPADGSSYLLLHFPHVEGAAMPLILEGPAARHPGGTHVLFADGKVEILTGRNYRGSFADYRELFDAIQKSRPYTAEQQKMLDEAAKRAENRQ